MCRLLLIATAITLLSGCGLYTPEKHPLVDNSPDAQGHTYEGNYADGIVVHVVCEIAEGLRASQQFGLPWLNEWGTTVTQSITAEDQSGFSPGVTLFNPLPNFSQASPAIGPLQLYTSQSIGASASANALRTETIQYTFRNYEILKNIPDSACDKNGLLIDGDLRIKEFIRDNAYVARAGNASTAGKHPFSWKAPVFNVFTEEITFVAAFGGNFTPTWKLAKVQANSSSNLLIAQRTTTNDLVITLGPLDPNQPRNSPVQLIANAQNQHLARVQAAAIAVSIQGQSH